MAEKDKIILEVDINGVKQNISSVKDLKDSVKKLEETAKKADFGSKEFKEATESAEKLKGKMNEISTTTASGMGKSLNELKKQYKDLKVAMAEAADPKEFARLSAELNEVEGRIGDINDAASIATGSGVEQLNKGMGLVTEGFRNFDFEKIKIGFRGIGQAMSAVTPLLLVEGIRLLIENYDELVGWVKQAFGIWSDEEEAVRAATKAYEAQKIATSALVNEYNREIAVLEAQGASEKEIIALKKEKIAAQVAEMKAAVVLANAKIAEIQANDTLWESGERLIVQILRKAGKAQEADALEANIQKQKLARAEEDIKKRIESNEAIANLENELLILDINANKKKIENSKKYQEELNKEHEAFLAMNKARREAMEASIEQSNEINRKLLKERQDEEDKIAQEQADKEYALLIKKLEDKKKAEAKAAEEKKKSDDAINEAELKGIQAAQSLTQGFYAFRLASAKGNAEEELKIKKQMFQVDKAFNIARAIQDGIRSVQAALTIPPPGGQILAGVNAAIAAGNVAKIAATTFDGASAQSAPNLSGGNAAFTQAPNLTATTQQSNVTQLNSDGTVANGNKMAAPVKAYVVETEVSATQKKVAKLSNQSKIG